MCKNSIAFLSTTRTELTLRTSRSCQWSDSSESESESESSAHMIWSKHSWTCSGDKFTKISSATACCFFSILRKASGAAWLGKQLRRSRWHFLGPGHSSESTSESGLLTEKMACSSWMDPSTRKERLFAKSYVEVFKRVYFTMFTRGHRLCIAKLTRPVFYCREWHNIFIVCHNPTSIEQGRASQYIFRTMMCLYLWVYENISLRAISLVECADGTGVISLRK